MNIITMRDSRKSDPDARFYRFEDEAVGECNVEPPMSEAQALTFLREVWHQAAPGQLPLNFDLPELKVRHRRSGRYQADADYGRHRIAVDSPVLRRHWVLHEAAHLLLPDHRNHGPMFARTLFQLWERWLGVPVAHAEQLAKQHGIAVAEASSRTPPLRGRP